MGGTFQAEPGAIAAAGKKFLAEVQPINTLATKAEDLQLSAGNAGRAYSSQGTSYHATLLTFVQGLFTPMATKATWLGDSLGQSATDYQNQDASAKAGVTAAGNGA